MTFNERGLIRAMKHAYREEGYSVAGTDCGVQTGGGEMKIDDAVQVIKPSMDSHYRLVPCQCGSDNVAYVLGADGRWRVQCFDCGHNGSGAIVRHEAQQLWNKGGTA